VRHSGEKDSETLFPELMSQLSPENLDQVKALGIATEAFKELSPATSNRIPSLTQEEKKTLFDLVRGGLFHALVQHQGGSTSLFFSLCTPSVQGAATGLLGTHLLQTSSPDF
jgi:hypothetical protein